MTTLNKFISIRYPIVLLDRVLTSSKFPQKYKHSLYKILAWVTTYYFFFAIYYSYTVLSTVKGTFNPPCLSRNDTRNLSMPNSTQDGNCSGWEPFIGNHGNTLLGILDFVSLFSFAILNIIIGNITDHFDYRYNICVGGVILFLSSTLFGSGYYLEIHSFPYYLFAQVLLGVGACGVSGCMGVIGKWFHGKRSGIIIGIWTTSIPLSRLLGKPLSGIWSDHAWGASFYSCSIISGTATLLIFLFLAPGPSYLQQHKEAPTLEQQNHKKSGISFLKAFCIPGVVEYSFVVFFIFIAFYSLFFWFPYLIRNSVIEGVVYTTSVSSMFSIAFDVGGLVGTVVGGGLSDFLGSHAITVTLYLYLSILLLYCYYLLYTIKLVYNLIILFSIGCTLGGAFTIVSNIAISLGSHKSLQGNVNAVATILGILGLFGSFGGALGGLITGYLFEFGIAAVLFFIMVSAFIAVLFLTRITFKDCCKLVKRIYSFLKCNRHVYAVQY